MSTCAGRRRPPRLLKIQAGVLSDSWSGAHTTSHVHQHDDGAGLSRTVPALQMPWKPVSFPAAWPWPRAAPVSVSLRVALDQFDTHAQHGYLRHCRLARELSGHWLPLALPVPLALALRASCQSVHSHCPPHAHIQRTCYLSGRAHKR